MYVLGCGPAYAQAVAEHALALALDLARGISREDLAFRAGHERYFADSNAASIPAARRHSRTARLWQPRPRPTPAAAAPRRARLVLVSRAAVVDYDALLAGIADGRFFAAVDVWPEEPVPAGHPARSLEGLILVLSTPAVAAASAIVTSPRTSCNQISYFWIGVKNRFARRPARSFDQPSSSIIRSSSIGPPPAEMMSDTTVNLYR